MSGQDHLRLLSRFAHGLHCEDLPQAVLETTKRFLADYYAACIAGYRVNARFNRAILAAVGTPVADGAPAAGGTSSVWFHDGKFPAEQAAFLNAVYAHGADMDDGNKKAMGHIAAHTISTVLALAEPLCVTWADVIAAIHVGYEYFNRLGAAVQPGLLHRGLHSTGIVGAMASAAAAAKLMGLDAAGIYSAASIAAVQSSGLLIITESGQECKPLNAANAARTGILSARLAAQGIRGPIGVLEHPKGWMHAVSDEVHPERITEGLGTVFTMQESYLKPYPSCRHTHCGIECAFRIRQALLAQYGEAFSDHIRCVHVYIYLNAIRVAGQIVRPESGEDAKFSIHYTLASALLYGHFGLCDLEIDTLPDGMLCMLEKIRLIADDSMENTETGIRGARVEVLLDDGAAQTAAVLTPKGEGEHPMTAADMAEKLSGCAAGVLSADEQAALLYAIDHIDLRASYHPIRVGKL